MHGSSRSCSGKSHSNVLTHLLPVRGFIKPHHPADFTVNTEWSYLKTKGIGAGCLYFSNYEVRKNEKLVAMFDDFNDYLGEEALWQISQEIKPREGKKKAESEQR